MYRADALKSKSHIPASYCHIYVGHYDSSCRSGTGMLNIRVAVLLISSRTYGKRT